MLNADPSRRIGAAVTALCVSVGCTALHTFCTRLLFHSDYARTPLPDLVPDSASAATTANYDDATTTDVWLAQCMRPWALHPVTGLQLQWDFVLLSPWLLYSPAAWLVLGTILLLLLVPRRQSPHQQNDSYSPTPPCWAVAVGLAYGAVFVRTVLAWLMFRALSWKFPRVFSHTVWQECGNHGLLAALVAGSVWMAGIVVNVSSIADTVDSTSNDMINHRRRRLTAMAAALLCGCVVAAGSADGGVRIDMFWSIVSGLLSGLFAIIGVAMNNAYNSYSSATPRRTVAIYWRRVGLVFLLVAVAYAVGVDVRGRLGADGSGSLFLQHSHEQLRNVAPLRKNLLTMLIVTAPRREHPRFLMETLESYVSVMPVDPTEPLYGRVNIVVYTHFAAKQHPVFAEAMRLYRHNPFVIFKNVVDRGPRVQKRHFSAALSYASNSLDTEYVMLLEDDFPLCDGCWDRLLHVMVYAQSGQAAGHCGIFVGTGGSGLVIRRQMVPVLAALLHEDERGPAPTDILIQRCLKGEFGRCAHCSNKLVISRTLYMRHIGFNASTYAGHSYDASSYQCGWRHPFNGSPQVIVAPF